MGEADRQRTLLERISKVASTGHFPFIEEHESFVKAVNEWIAHLPEERSESQGGRVFLITVHFDVAKTSFP